MLPRKEDIKLIKSEKFASRIINFGKYLKSKNEKTIREQVVRSGTSIGANISEAIYAQSKADYISKLSIALKEAKETEYWIKTAYNAEYIDETLYESLITDCVELIKILTSILKTLKSSN